VEGFLWVLRVKERSENDLYTKWIESGTVGKG
jgi:hypothetical protein